jgi:hypothetical protein
VSLLGSQSTGLGSVPTAAGGSGAGAGGGTIREITSTDGTVTITNPTGPVVDLSVLGAGEIVLGQVSYGLGEQGVDDVFPMGADSTASVAYMGAALNADTIGAPSATLGDSPRYEFAVPAALDRLRLLVFITKVTATGESFAGIGGKITIDGEEDATLGWGVVYDGGGTGSNIVQDASAEIIVAAGQSVGVTIGAYAGQTSGAIQVHILIVGHRDGDEGPYVSDDLTIRIEGAADAPPIVEGDDFEWVNQGSLGTAYNYVNFTGLDAPLVVTEGDVRYVNFDGNKMLVQATVPGTGIFNPPVGADFAPFYAAAVVRMNEAPNARQIWRYQVGPNIATLDVPLSTSFKLVWQWASDGAANVETVPDVTSDVLVWALLEWGYDGSEFFFILNGARVTVDNNSPHGTTPALVLNASYIGESAGINADLAALFIYRAFPTPGERAKTRAYLEAAYAELLP